MAKGNLARYNQKRKFAETPEPPGRVRASEGSRFSVQEHHARRLHYDLRLEMDGVLKSWAIPKGLPEKAGERRLAVMTEDHPIDYLDFEGIIPEGNYGAGRVNLWEIGTYQKVAGGLEEGKLTFVISGRERHGKYTLLKTGMQGGKSAWLIINGGAAPFPEGEAPLPAPFSPMRALLADAPFADPEWLSEPKWDGVRAIVRLQRQRQKIKVDLWGRNLSRFEAQYPEVVESLIGLMEANPAVDRLVLDGEVVAYDEKGRVSFQSLQRRMHLSRPDEIEAVRRTTPVDYILFDLLFINGASLVRSPFTYRRRLLSELDLPGATLRRSPIHEDGVALFKVLSETGGEGIVMKRKGSLYLPDKRSRDWMKVKIIQEKECVVAGWTEGRGNRSHLLGALLLGLYDGKDLIYIGHTGSGFDAEGLEEALRLLAPLETGRSPYKTRPVTNARAHWVRPELVAQVKFSNWTEERHLRAPVFMGFRDDVSAEECRFERQVEASGVITQKKEGKEAVWIGDRITARFEGRPIEVSHLDKVLWPEKGYTKAHMIEHYIHVAPFLLPHLAGRPLTLVRFPDGIHGGSFYQKDWKETPPLWVKRVLVQPGSKEEEKRRMIVCENTLTLIWLANLANIELHPWYSRVDDGGRKADRPDFIVFDIDPPKGDNAGVSWERFEQAAEVAFWLREMLAEEGIACWPKTSGKSGLHLFVPIVRKYSHAQTRQFARTAAERLQAAHPDRVTTAWQKEKRGKKVLVDFNQNARGKTLAAVYSLRATPEATVSTPFDWEELPAISPVHFTLETIPDRLRRRGDLWKEILNSPQALGGLDEEADSP